MHEAIVKFKTELCRDRQAYTEDIVGTRDLWAEQQEVDEGLSAEIRLQNTMFSDDVITTFQRMGMQASREQLDTGDARTQLGLWTKVHNHYQSDDDDLAAVLYTEPELTRIKVDAGTVSSHDALELKALWHKIKNRYKKASKGFKTSGFHNPYFFDFCNGHVGTYNLHLHLQQRPGMLEMVTAELPEAVRAESVNCAAVAAASASGERKRRPPAKVGAGASNPQVAVANALTAYTEAFAGDDAVLIQRKRQKIEEERLQLEQAAHNDNSEQRRVNIHGARIDQWAKLDDMIRTRKQQLNGLDKDDTAERADLEKDIERLKDVKAAVFATSVASGAEQL
eukprot:GHVU01210101.1.p1 GENE.GHVU01210101.1~~GHVU01210101.1.p1  ORF type:complete len:338 (-),score=59.10 GHVU01210101.1:345-1358(-)